ncbi:MAG: hypothetical protein ABNG98_01030 [Flavobacterium sp.]|jgi:hypothetical protein
MKKIVALFLITLFFISCKDERTKHKPKHPRGGAYVENYSDKNGNIIKKEYYTRKGVLYIVVNYKDNLITNIKELKDDKLYTESIVDKDLNSIKYIYKNDIIDRVCYGKVNSKGVGVGWWKIFDAKNNILEKVEFINYKGEPYYNQNYFYKNDGKIDTLKSSFFNLSFVKKNEKEYDCKVCYSEEIDSIFSNVNDVHLDTLFVKKKKEGNIFPVKFKENGLKTIRGYVIQYSKTHPHDSTSTDGVQIIKYFEKKF